jgi:phage FluMu protein Com
MVFLPMYKCPKCKEKITRDQVRGRKTMEIKCPHCKTVLEGDLRFLLIVIIVFVLFYGYIFFNYFNPGDMIHVYLGVIILLLEIYPIFYLTVRLKVMDESLKKEVMKGKEIE